MVVSFDVEEKSSLLSLAEFDRRIGLSFELELFTFDVDEDNDDEHFCRLFICFKS